MITKKELLQMLSNTNGTESASNIYKFCQAFRLSWNVSSSERIERKS